jgi:hypothetical protein
LQDIALAGIGVPRNLNSVAVFLQAGLAETSSFLARQGRLAFNFVSPQARRRASCVSLLFYVHDFYAIDSLFLGNALIISKAMASAMWKNSSKNRCFLGFNPAEKVSLVKTSQSMPAGKLSLFAGKVTTFKTEAAIRTNDFKFTIAQAVTVI